MADGTSPTHDSGYPMTHRQPSSLGPPPGQHLAPPPPQAPSGPAPPRTFAEAIKTCFRKYATFTGRASRSEYWFFFLFAVATGLGVGILPLFMSLGVPALGGIFTVLLALVWLASIVPHLAVAARRLHDSGLSGWLLLIAFIPFGSLILLGMLALKPQAQVNRYG